MRSEVWWVLWTRSVRLGPVFHTVCLLFRALDRNGLHPVTNLSFSPGLSVCLSTSALMLVKHIFANGMYRWGESVFSSFSSSCVLGSSPQIWFACRAKHRFLVAIISFMAFALKTNVYSWFIFFPPCSTWLSTEPGNVIKPKCLFSVVLSNSRLSQHFDYSSECFKLIELISVVWGIFFIIPLCLFMPPGRGVAMLLLSSQTGFSAC